jgi:hypothetical protein
LQVFVLRTFKYNRVIELDFKVDRAAPQIIEKRNPALANVRLCVIKRIKPRPILQSRKTQKHKALKQILNDSRDA